MSTKSIEPKELTEEEVPQGIKDDLTEHYGNVTFDLNIDIDENTKSVKSNYTTKETTLEKGVLCDAETFAPMLAEGYPGESYLIRINPTPDGVSVRRVISMHTFERVNIIGPFEV